MSIKGVSGFSFDSHKTPFFENYCMVQTYFSPCIFKMDIIKSLGRDIIMLTAPLFSCKISLTAWHIANHFLKTECTPMQ